MTSDVVQRCSARMMPTIGVVRGKESWEFENIFGHATVAKEAHLRSGNANDLRGDRLGNPSCTGHRCPYEAADSSENSSFK
jgi:hypothetical protein